MRDLVALQKIAVVKMKRNAPRPHAHSLSSFSLGSSYGMRLSLVRIINISPSTHWKDFREDSMVRAKVINITYLFVIKTPTNLRPPRVLRTFTSLWFKRPQNGQKRKACCLKKMYQRVRDKRWNGNMIVWDVRMEDTKG